MCELLHVHFPFRHRSRYLPFILEHHLQPEIALVAGDFAGSDAPLKALGKTLKQAGLRCTVHAPFMDLNPGAVDPAVQKITRHRFDQSLDAAALLGARVVVFHPGYDRWRYGGQQRLWIDQNLEFWPPLLKKAERLGIRMALENIFEEQPDTLVELLEAIDSPWLGHCFDCGHWNLFSTVALEDWLEALGERLIHLHLHDNRGERDAHLPIGEGDIPFQRLFEYLRTLKRPPTMTLEAHDPEDALTSLAAASALLLR